MLPEEERGRLILTLLTFPAFDVFPVRPSLHVNVEKQKTHNATLTTISAEVLLIRQSMNSPLAPQKTQ